MSTVKVLDFEKCTGTMTIEEGLSFITRMRRKLDRLDVATPGMKGKRMEPQTEAKIRAICDEVEAELLAEVEPI